MTVPDVKNLPISKVKTKIKEVGLGFRVKGDGEMVYKQIHDVAVFIKKMELFYSISISDDLSEGETIIPDLTECTIKKASHLLENIGLK